MSGYETVIGLELHAQLRTETKLFCRCRTRFSDPVLCQNSAQPALTKERCFRH